MGRFFSRWPVLGSGGTPGGFTGLWRNLGSIANRPRPDFGVPLPLQMEFGSTAEGPRGTVAAPRLWSAMELAAAEGAERDAGGEA